ncbi:hypothetical protein L249_8282 [Ophiocordyceps polyrhachis-furcata BCC 54312]|uniref:Pop1 N-terminal domain-containing protein n=1 Tax=Ophiocordyceps polyrhachis-furcata BCC 54312 TaxID=1330021 RepID=A0A367LH97_9HYPO|nr:hypothetical protein L249_8282 [Ophiocordyceps polyrhachis-furcata BCC 54312]
MAPKKGMKRGAPPADAQHDPARQKRAKIHAARSIPVQPPDAAFKDGELDLQAFVAAHEFEIRALEQSMASSKAVSASRAFQKVPRGLRRRNASHNPKRIPRRLRARARREMMDDNTPTVEARRRKPRTTRARLRAETAKKIALLVARKRRKKLKDGGGATAAAAGAAAEPVDVVVGRKPRPKIRRNQLNEPPRPAAKFRRRQINKTWLPTHTWHAKRARMTDPKSPLWRFAIPVTPNEKIHRLTHRSHGDRGTMLWDMSYMSTVGLYGCVAGVERVLRRGLGIDQDSCWNERGRRWRAGTRSWSGLLSREKEPCRRVICPATVVWKAASPEEGDKRQVYLRVHPSAFLELFNELLRLTKMEKPRMYIEDLRFEIGSLELSGPASTEALLAVLEPFTKDDDVPPSKHAGIFNSLDGLTNPATLPAGALLAFCIQDPRLRFPPRRRSFSVDDEAQMKLLRTVAEWSADEDPESSALFDRDARHRASCLPSQKSIDRRRGAAAAAGQVPTLTPVDPPIPIMLIASRSTGFLHHHLYHSQGSWTVLAPWKCIPGLWHSLVRMPLSCGSVPRFGGLSQVMQVSHERGVPWFPADFPATDAGARWEADQRLSRRDQWRRRPKSKRLSWDAVDLGAGRRGEVGDGLACHFELLLSLPRREAPSSPSPPPAEEGGGTENEEDKAEEKEQDAFPSLARLTTLSQGQLTRLLKDPTLPPPPQEATVQVRLRLSGRGKAKACARIYRLPSPPPDAAQVASAAASSSTSLPPDLRAQWLATRTNRQSRGQRGGSRGKATMSTSVSDMEVRKRILARQLLNYDGSTDENRHPLIPSRDHLIGFVTSGAFSLVAGHAVAFASLCASSVVADLRDASSSSDARYCIVRNAGENVGWLARWEAL